jgi:hypothetical protein
MTILCQIILDPYDIRFVFDDTTEIYAEKYLKYYLIEYGQEFEINFCIDDSYLNKIDNYKFTKLIGKEVIYKTLDGQRAYIKFLDGSYLLIIGFS